MQHSILVGVNGTPGSWYALEQALARAEGHDARVVALFVEPPAWVPPVLSRPMYEALFRTATHEMARRHNVPLEFRVRHGFPARTIAEQARVLGSDLIVLGHSDDSAFHRWMTTSVSALVHAQAPCRTMVIHVGDMTDVIRVVPPAVLDQGPTEARLH
jgi:nucleotide-binding universal stress UspA family protein